MKKPLAHQISPDQPPHQARPEITIRELLTDQEVAEYIGGITARTVREWRAKRGLPFIRLTNKVIRVRRADLDGWLVKQRVARMQ